MEMKFVKAEQMDQIWKKLLLVIIGESWEFSEYVTGIRLVDRQKKHSTLKVEIWVTFGSKNPKFNKDELREIKDRFRVSMFEQIQAFYKCISDDIFYTDHGRKLN